MLSGRLEWMLDNSEKAFDGMTEAEFLAKSIKDVADHYGTGLFDQKTLDWMNLIQCVAIVYGGRIFAIRANPKPKPVKMPTVQEAAGMHQASPVFHRTPPPSNEFNGSSEANTVNIAGIGDVQIPDDDPLSPNYKPKWN
jgi:hypothetical protein